MTETSGANEQAPVLVTGASRRVGLHIANRFLEQQIPVLAHYRTLTPELEALAEKGATLYYADLANTESVTAMCSEIKDRHNQIRAIVHNASSYGKTEDDAQAAMQQYLDFFHVHMASPFLINESLFECLKQYAGVADIIHITDIYVESPKHTYHTYCSTKAGLANLSRSFAAKFAPHVKVNAIAPGPIWLLDSYSQAYKDMVFDQTLIREEGGPEPIYLAIKSIMENPYMTASTVTVDGGRSLNQYVLPQP